MNTILQPKLEGTFSFLKKGKAEGRSGVDEDHLEFLFIVFSCQVTTVQNQDGRINRLVSLSFKYLHLTLFNDANINSRNIQSNSLQSGLLQEAWLKRNYY